MNKLTLTIIKWVLPFLLGLSFLFVLLIPPVWHLKEGKIKVTRYFPPEQKRLVEVGPQVKRTWTPLNEVSMHFIAALLISEDATFFRHHGLDWQQIWESIQTNLEQQRYARGASTITQQVVKMAFLSREKNLLRKFREAMGALWLEQILTKHDILAWYINLAEFGYGIYGIKQAARHYFNTEPIKLTIAQSIHLAMILPSPTRWSYSLRRRKLTKFGHKRFAKILYLLYKTSRITYQQWQVTAATADFGNPLKIPKEYEVEPPENF